jgi:hypothetical protein
MEENHHFPTLSQSRETIGEPYEPAIIAIGE